jgi:hypothetical protein
MTKPELLCIQICRVVKLTSIFRSSLLEDRYLNRLKYIDQIIGHDRMPTPTVYRPMGPPNGHGDGRSFDII